MEKNECYVCLEECQEEYSPCECKIPIHHKCFIALENVEQCTVCKDFYIFENIEIMQETPEQVVIVQKKTKKHTFCTILFSLCIMFVMWYFAGVFGKAVWVILGGTLKHNTYEFWNEEQVLSSIITILCLIIFYYICRKKPSTSTSV